MTATTQRYFHLSPVSPALQRLQEAEAFFLRGNLNEALAAARQAWQEHPQEPDVFRVLAYLHMARGEYPPAAKAAYQSVVIDGDNPASYATLAQVYTTFNMVALAEETLTTALQRFFNDVTLLTLMADLRFRRAQTAEGERLASQALALNPDDGYAQALLGTHYLRKKRYSEARPLLEHAVTAYPQRWDYQRDYGIALLYLGLATAATFPLAFSCRQNMTDAATKQHLYLAVKLSSESPTNKTLWGITLFFYRHAGFGWCCAIIGALLGIIGLITGLVTAANATSSNIDTTQALLSATFLFAGACLLFFPWRALWLLGKRMHQKFDAILAQDVERILQPTTATGG